jgi:hypothetical protein
VSDLTVVLAVFGAVFLFIIAFTALAIKYTKINHDYQEVSLYDSRHDEPVTGRGDCSCHTLLARSVCDHRYTCRYEHGDPESR